MFEVDDVGRPVAIVSHAFWRAKLAADPGAIGREVVLGGRAHTIVGVLPEQFFFALESGPMCGGPCRCRLTRQRAQVSGSRGGSSRPQRLFRRTWEPRWTKSVGDPHRRHRSSRRGWPTAIAGDATRTLGLLAGAAALAFLIAFANLAGLLLVRSIDRRRELAVRAALGARPSEIARQLVLEAETLVAIGIVGGVLLALWLTPAVGRLALEQFGARGEPRGGGELARDRCRGDRRGGLCGNLWTAAGLCRVTTAMSSTCCVAASRRLPVSLACAACSSSARLRWRACCSCP